MGRRLPLPSGEQPGRARLRASRSITRIRICRRSRNSSAGRRIRRSAPRSRAGGACPMARGRSTRAASRRSRSWSFPGGALIGCSAGFVNVPRIKGTHTAMKSAMLAAEAAFEAIPPDRSSDVLEAYPPALHKSWVAKELKMVRNAQPAVAHWGGTAWNALRRARYVAECARDRRAVDAQARPDNTTPVAQGCRPSRSTIPSPTAC